MGDHQFVDVMTDSGRHFAFPLLRVLQHRAEFYANAMCPIPRTPTAEQVRKWRTVYEEELKLGQEARVWEDWLRSTNMPISALEGYIVEIPAPIGLDEVEDALHKDDPSLAELDELAEPGSPLTAALEAILKRAEEGGSMSSLPEPTEFPDIEEWLKKRSQDLEDRWVSFSVGERVRVNSTFLSDKSELIGKVGTVRKVNGGATSVHLDGTPEYWTFTLYSPELDKLTEGGRHE